MKDHAHKLIATAARELAGTAHAKEELHDVLFKLVLECISPEGRPVVPVRHMPAAGEVLPPQQRATWARALTAYDAPSHVIDLEARRARKQVAEVRTIAAIDAFVQRQPGDTP